MSKILNTLASLNIPEGIIDSIDKEFANRSCVKVNGSDQDLVFTNAITIPSENKHIKRLNSSHNRVLENAKEDDSFLNAWQSYSSSIFIKSLAFCSIYCGGNWDSVVRAENVKIYTLTANGFKYPNFTSHVISNLCEALFEDQPSPKIISIGVSSLPNGTFMVMDSIFSVYR